MQSSEMTFEEKVAELLASDKSVLQLLEWIVKAHESEVALHTERAVVEAQRLNSIELPNLKWMQIICSEDGKKWRSPMIKINPDFPITLTPSNPVEAGFERIFGKLTPIEDDDGL